MKCSEAMRPYDYHCRVKDTALQCARLMKDHGLRIVPITDDVGQVLGVVTDRDLVVRLIAHGRSLDTPLASFVSMDRLIACSPEDDLDVAVDRMFRARIPRILILDESRRCLGMLSLSDLARNRTGPDQVFRLLYAIDSRPDMHASPTPNEVLADAKGTS